MQSTSRLSSGTEFAVAAGQIRLRFDQGDAGTQITHLTDAEGREYLRRPNVLWQIEMIDQGKHLADLDMSGIVPSIRRGSEQVRLVWRDVQIGTTGRQLTVKLTMQLNDANGELGFQLRVEDVPDEWSVFRVHFPRLDLAVRNGDESEAMILPSDRGIIYRNPLATMPTGGIHEKIRKRPYPNGNFTMQFLALQRENQLLYIGAHDRNAHLKTFFMGPDVENELIYVHPYSDTEIHYGQDWEMPYSWVIRIQRGDWYDAAQVYRKFAMTTRWIRNGPLVEAKRTPLWYQKIGLVTLRLLRGPGFEDEDVLAEQAFMGTPMICHYYMWHQSAFDAQYPLFFPANPGFRNTIKLLEANNVHVLPYINMFSGDMVMPAWEQGLKGSAAQINPQGDYDLHVWSQNRMFATLCPGAAMPRQLTCMTAVRLVEQGVSAVYFDEIAMSAPWPCHDEKHNHPIGGGTTFVSSMVETLRVVREECNQVKPEGVVLGTEGCAEPYIEQIDTMAIGNGNKPNAVPMFEVVYHDHVMGFGRYTFTSELTDPRFLGAIESKHAEQFVWGTQFGWSDVPLSRIIQKLPAAATFIRHMAHTWKYSYDFLAQGQMLRPLDLSDQLKPVTRKWAMSWLDETGTDVSLMPVLNSVWKRVDGSIGVVLVNITDEPVSLLIKLPSIQSMYAKAMKDCTQAEFDAATLSRLYPLPQRAAGEVRAVIDDKYVTDIAEGDSERGFSLTIPPMSARVIAMGSEKFYGLT